MADYTDSVDEAAPDTVQSAVKLLSECKKHWSDIYRKAKEDLEFLSDKEGSQWDSGAFTDRLDNGRPALQIDQLAQFVNQVSNNVRMNTPSINVIPNDQIATKETAEIIKGRIKDIEYNSNADDAYDNAVNSAIKCGIGFIRIDHDWKDGSSFDQQIFIKRVVNPFSVYLDPCSIEPDGSDAEYGFVIDELPLKLFEKEHPGKDPVSFCFDDGEKSRDKEKETVKIAEMFKIERQEVEYGLLPDGSAEEVRDGAQYLRTRKGEKRVVRRYLLSGADVLRESVFPGDYIGIVPVYGEEAWEAGERKLNSLIRKAKDAQRMYNYHKTAEADYLMRSPKAIAIAPYGTTEDFADDWKHPEKAAVLRYKPIQAANGQFMPPPSLTNPPQIPAGFVQASQAAAQDIKATMGLYNAFLGDRSNETSGVAIQARKVEGDRAVYHFGDNLVRSITQVGRVIVSMLPVIDDTPKLVNTIGTDGKQKIVGINGMTAEGQEQTVYLTKGKYSVRVTTGSSLSTMRQEFALVMQSLIEKQPDLLTVIGDVYFENQDFPGAAAIADRMKKILRPEVRDTEGEQDPQTAALTQENQQLKGAMQQMQAELQSKQADLQIKQQEIAMKAQSEQADNQLEVAKLQIDEARLVAEIDIKRQEMALKERELALKEAEAVLAAQRETAGAVAQPQLGAVTGVGA